MAKVGDAWCEGVMRMYRKFVDTPRCECLHESSLHRDRTGSCIQCFQDGKPCFSYRERVVTAEDRL